MNPPAKAKDIMDLTYFAMNDKNPKQFRDSSLFFKESTAFKKKFDEISLENYNKNTWKKVAV